eukprot:UN17972
MKDYTCDVRRSIFTFFNFGPQTPLMHPSMNCISRRRSKVTLFVDTLVKLLSGVSEQRKLKLRYSCGRFSTTCFND